MEKTQVTIGVSLGHLQFQILFTENDLFRSTITLQNCVYMNFRINLTRFYINFSRQEYHGS